MTVNKGSNSTYSIGTSEIDEEGYYGAITIGGTVYFNDGSFENGGDSYLKTSPFVYPAPALLQVTVHESSYSTGFGDHIIYYASGETWEQAIAKHPTENVGWSIKSEGDYDYVYYGENQVWNGGGVGVFSDEPIDANDYYEF